MAAPAHHRLRTTHLVPSALAACLASLPAAWADGGGTFSLYDADRNGFLEPAEFTTLAASRHKRPDDAAFWAFARVDADGDSRVSEQELVNALLEDVKRRQEIGR
jgi:Ca2+-binding EF-hand superfamily protein